MSILGVRSCGDEEFHFTRTWCNVQQKHSPLTAFATRSCSNSSSTSGTVCASVWQEKRMPHIESANQSASVGSAGDRRASCAPKKARAVIWPRSVHSLHTVSASRARPSPVEGSITPHYLHMGRVVCDEQVCVENAPHVPGQVVIFTILSFRTERLRPRAMRETSLTEIDDLRQSHIDILLPCIVRDVASSGQGTLSAVSCLRYICLWGARLLACRLLVSPRHVWAEAFRPLACVRPYGLSNRMCTA